MDCIVLAGGYARRMSPLTDNQPKHLLPVAGRPMIQYVLDKIEAAPGLRDVYISTNSRFESHFRTFLEGYRSRAPIRLVVEQTCSESEKLGSLGAIAFIVEKEKLDDELLIIGGDNLFDFQLGELLAFYREKRGVVIAVYDVGMAAMSSLYGVATLGSNSMVTSFQEKPRCLAATACYVLPRESLQQLKEYLALRNNADAMGNFIQWLLKYRTPVYGYLFDGNWFDIGSIESYKEADECYAGRASAAKGARVVR